MGRLKFLAEGGPTLINPAIAIADVGVEPNVVPCGRRIELPLVSALA